MRNIVGSEAEHEQPIDAQRNAATRRHVLERLQQLLIDRKLWQAAFPPQRELCFEAPPLLARTGELSKCVRELDAADIGLEAFGHRRAPRTPPRQSRQWQRPVVHEHRPFQLRERRFDPLHERTEKQIIPGGRAAGVDAGRSHAPAKLFRAFVPFDSNVGKPLHRLAYRHGRPARAHIDLAAGNLDDRAAAERGGDRCDQFLGITLDGVEIAVGAVPFEHRELAAVLMADLLFAKAMTEREDPLAAGRQQPFHLKLGRRNEIVLGANRNRPQVNFQAGCTHEQRRIHLEEVSFGEEPPDRRQGVRTLLQKLGKFAHWDHDIYRVPIRENTLKTPRHLRNLLFRVLQVGAAACFIGHGAFGILTKKEWCVFFDLVGIAPDAALRLMPLIGTMDITLGLLVLFRPMPAPLLFMAGWATWTALCRPLAGLGFWEFFERAGNFGVALSLLALSGWTPARGAWFARLSPGDCPPPGLLFERVLRAATALLFIGHGGFGLAMGKSMLLEHWSALGLDLDQRALAAIGAVEILLGVAALFIRRPSFFLFLCGWKLTTELLYPLSGAPLWEFIERGGSYACPLALFFFHRGTRPAHLDRHLRLES